MRTITDIINDVRQPEKTLLPDVVERLIREHMDRKCAFFNELDDVRRTALARIDEDCSVAPFITVLNEMMLGLVSRTWRERSQVSDGMCDMHTEDAMQAMQASYDRLCLALQRKFECNYSDIETACRLALEGGQIDAVLAEEMKAWAINFHERVGQVASEAFVSAVQQFHKQLPLEHRFRRWAQTPF